MDRGENYVIRAEGLGKVFRTGRVWRRGSSVVAVDGVDLAVRRGETFGLIGPDGAGKTTTIRLLTGLLRPTAGRAEVLGFDVRRQAQSVRARVGYMAQQFRLYGDLTVAENLHFFADVHGLSRAERAERIPRLLAFAGLERFQKRLGSRLSGGMKKKLALASMLLHEPELVFLDEPTLGVDPVSRREFWDILARLRAERGLTILVSTPYMDEAERCHRVALIYGGRLIAQGAPDEIERRAPGQCLEFRPSDFRRARALAPSLPGVLEVQTCGHLLHVFVDDAAGREGEIGAALAAQGIGVTGLRRIPPRMEGAFISLIRRQANGVQDAENGIRNV
jgi:ABC-2 type transport system ATP-binding protein